jgi:hypothetical protein
MLPNYLQKEAEASPPLKQPFGYKFIDPAKDIGGRGIVGSEQDVNYVKLLTLLLWNSCPLLYFNIFINSTIQNTVDISNLINIVSGVVGLKQIPIYQYLEDQKSLCPESFTRAIRSSLQFFYINEEFKRRVKLLWPASSMVKVRRITP